MNDIQEASATKKLDASYGPVIIWDSLAFFAWMRAIDLCDGSDLSEFRRSFSVLTLPLWMLGREIIWSPFAGIKPYVDLVAEELTAGLWLPLLWVRSMQTPRAHVAGRLLVAFVLFGGAYAWISDLEDVAFLAYKPLDHLVSVRPYEKLGIPTYTENFIFVFLAALAVALVERWNPRGLGERLGLRAASLSETAPSPTSG